MQQIADWLKKLGMSEYAQGFAENDVDLSVLPHLTDQDLKELGISLGHRRKMLAAIASLSGGVTPTELKPQDAADRRQQPSIPTPSTTTPLTSTTPEAAGERR